MFRDLLLPTTNTAGDANAIDAGVALAAAFDAHLAVVETVNLPMYTPSPWGITPDTLLTGLYEELKAQGRANIETLRQRLAREAISHEVRMAEAKFVEPARCIAMQARHADLVVLAGAAMQAPFDTEAVETIFGGLLFESGRPVLVIPPRYLLEWPMRHVVVAWHPTREATRALHDAMPFLVRAQSVDVVAVDPERGDAHHGDTPGADIAAHLARHGLKVNVVQRARGSDTVATALLRHAADTDAQLLVAGGFGHSRLLEWVLGGTTTELMRAMHLPVLFSH